jgi:selenocysteine lyase/cysteine desulfurase
MQTTYHPQPTFPARLQTLRAACPLLNTALYLANCSQGPLSTPVHTAIETFLDQWANLGMHWDAWVEEVERARAAFAALIGAAPGEIAVGSSVSQLVSSLASALRSAPYIRRRRVVTSTIEFPGVAHAWLALRHEGWQVDVLSADEDGLVSGERFAAAADETTALVSVPHVCYIHGALIDLSPVVKAAHEQGALVFVDAYQSIGTVPIDVKASGIDFLAAGTLKYLLGTAGIAFLYVNPALIERLEPTVTGWFGRQQPFAFDPTLLDYAGTAARFDLGTPPIINAYAARAGMQLVLDAGIDEIRAQVERLSTLAYDLAARLDLHVIGPRQAAQKGATTAIDTGSPERAHTLENELRQHSIIASARGRGIRLAPHGFTYEEELQQALHTVARLLHHEV